MWLRRTKSTSQSPNLPPFSCSLKDIQSLFEEDNNTNTNTKSLNINVLTRVGSTKALLYPLKKPPRKDNGVVLRRGLQDQGVLDHVEVKGDSLAEVDLLRRGVSDGRSFLLEDEGVLEKVEVKGGLIKDRLGEVVDVKDGSKGVVGIELPGTETMVVIFFTSLRVVRNTFEDCKYVRTILHSFPVAIDERDLSMDMRFMKELQRIMGGGGEEKSCLRLPLVFIGGRYIGGAEEIRQLHEAGELKKYLQGLAPKPAGTCEVCGGHGFVLCEECNGSHKCYVDKGGFRTCSGCNENGLVRCSSCSSLPL